MIFFAIVQFVRHFVVKYYLKLAMLSIQEGHIRGKRKTKAKIIPQPTSLFFIKRLNYSWGNPQSPFFRLYSIPSDTQVGPKNQKSKNTIQRLQNLVPGLKLLHRYLNTRFADLFQGYVEKLQIELQRCQENYLDAMDKCSVLEEELNTCKDKLSIFEQDDLGTVLVTLTSVCYVLISHC